MSITQEAFNIHASVVFHLGESLITDEIQALLELVKNSYDANARHVFVSVTTADGGNIVIEDDGDGMDLISIRRGWLTIADSHKRELKRNGNLKQGQRVPLGDKGLGRLGAQRLAESVEIFTKPKDNDTFFRVSFDWSQFSVANLLTDVTADIEEICPAPSNVGGTKIILNRLRNTQYWQESKEELRKQISRILSPYQEIAQFQLIVRIDGEKLDLTEISTRLLDTAQVRQFLKYQNQHLSFTGEVRLEYFLSSKDDDEKRIWQRLAARDGGESFFGYLCTLPRAKRDYNLVRSENSGWFVRFNQEQSQLNPRLSGFLNPGDFQARADFFDFGSESVQSQSIFDRAKEYKDFIKDLSGIRIYRDGFAVRVPKNWLNLGKQWTTGTWYTLKPENTIGYVSLSAKDNGVLEETTDREGFVHNSYYLSFETLLNEWIKFTGEVQTFLRRSWNEFKDQHLQDEIGKAGLSAEKTADDLATNLARAAELQTPINQFAPLLHQTVERARDIVTAADNSLFGSDDNLLRTVNNLDVAASQAEDAIEELGNILSKLGEQQKVSQLLQNQIGLLRGQLEQVYELVGLGLTAEALSHQITQIVDEMSYRTNQMRLTIQSSVNPDGPMLAYLSRTGSSLASLLKQLSHLAPSLRYVREKREQISLHEFFIDQAEYLRARSNQKIPLIDQGSQGSNFLVTMNAGKLVQVVDNLLLNSEYWLRELKIKKPKIFFELSKPYVRVWDNGIGIDTNVENSIFEAFITRKPAGVGRGLGLFIIRQLLDSDGASVYLTSERNEYGRLYKFEINLANVVSE